MNRRLNIAWTLGFACALIACGAAPSRSDIDSERPATEPRSKPRFPGAAEPAHVESALTNEDRDASDHELSLADLADYRRALGGRAIADDDQPPGSPLDSSFRDLWDGGRGQARRGRRVRVEGRVARVFRQGAVGDFPALVQLWAFSPAGDPFCLVFPDPSDPDRRNRSEWSKPDEPESEPASRQTGDPSQNKNKDRNRNGNQNGPRQNAESLQPGRRVAFVGTFLKLIEYPAGDQPRIAPLIVGDRPAELLLPASARETQSRSQGRDHPRDWQRLDRIVGLIAAIVVIAFLAQRHARRPTARPRPQGNSAERDVPSFFLDQTDP
jgi:hypothetical protein